MCVRGPILGPGAGDTETKVSAYRRAHIYPGNPATNSGLGAGKAQEASHSGLGEDGCKKCGGLLVVTRN